MPTVRTAAVIGAGIAGPVTALALHKAGIEATIFEDHRTSAEGLGGTFGLAPNGVAALEIVGVEPTGQPIHHQQLSLNGKLIRLPSLSGAGPLQMIRRGDLYRLLHDRVAAEGIRIEHGKRLSSVREEPGAVTAVFADGDTRRFDVLIGADGVHSTVRKLIDPSAPEPRFTGMVSIEGRSATEVPVDPDTATFAFGKHGYYLYWATPGGGTVWGVNLPHRPMSIAESRAIPGEQWMAILLQTYGDDDPGAAILRGTDPADLLANGALHIMPRAPHWHRARMALVGDAVHAPSNSSGQGASLAIESAIELARCLRDIADVTDAFAAYERLRRNRVEQIAARLPGSTR
ncbi:FAD-dependent oxidoreductase [Actinoplanes sp. OR16]|uniref:FAD-dependent monooxygenase n=1 Tax=Actinoplanes sp. OR16 TaxID=946334 RepID=UPI000F71A572|nr:NAD(P)/FAD-dependent oxidoreductase [Actinoplanes sp. OR16]BBH67786.1 FAD-dependent oxidoreductase [Actinoplanes sp. OR16]